MRPTLPWLLPIALLLATTLLATTPAHASSGAEARAEAVRAFVEASNRHDVEAMLAATEPDFRWLQVTGDRVATEVAGHADLRSWLEGYFRGTSEARSTVGPVSVGGDYATALETVRWTGGDGRARAQTAVSVYRFAEDGRISAVWYFPAQDAGAASDVDAADDSAAAAADASSPR